MDTIFFNGCIRTLDDSEKVAEAVGIENGRIVFVGTDKAVSYTHLTLPTN